MTISNETVSMNTESERISQSVSQNGKCLDNSVIEGFFIRLKDEVLFGIIQINARVYF